MQRLSGVSSGSAVSSTNALAFARTSHRPSVCRSDDPNWPKTWKEYNPVIHSIHSASEKVNLEHEVVGVFADRVEAEHEQVDDELDVTQTLAQIVQTQRQDARQLNTSTTQTLHTSVFASAALKPLASILTWNTSALMASSGVLVDGGSTSSSSSFLFSMNSSSSPSANISIFSADSPVSMLGIFCAKQSCPMSVLQSTTPAIIHEVSIHLTLFLRSASLRFRSSSS